MQASRRLLDDDLTARLAIQNRAFAFRHSSLSSDSGSTSNSTYERIYPLCADYQEPSRLIRKLPEFAHSAENLGKPQSLEKTLTIALQKPRFEVISIFSPESSSSCMAATASGSDGAPHYAEADIISLQESSDSSIAAANMTPFTGTDSSLREFPREKLSFKEKLGEGQFGEVSLQPLGFIDSSLNY